MYNSRRIIELLDSSGARRKDLLDFIGKNFNGSVESIIKGDIRVSKLEKIADFFGVSVDTFFDRETVQPGVNVGGSNNRVHHFAVGISDTERNSYEALIAEKDCRIADLQDTIKILKRQLSID